MTGKLGFCYFCHGPKWVIRTLFGVIRFCPTCDGRAAA